MGIVISVVGLARVDLASATERKEEEYRRRPTLHQRPQVPPSLPSQLMEQRPDVRQAEENLHSASALIGVARANRLPSFNLTPMWAAWRWFLTTCSGQEQVFGI